MRWLHWRTDRELEEEIQSHLDLEIQANLERGMSPEDARFAALRHFGNTTRVRERAREADPLFLAQTFARDLLHGLRALRLNPSFAAAAAVSLALGIGANTLVFSLLDSTLLKPLGFPHPERLTAIWTVPLDKPDRVSSSSVSTYFALRDGAQSFETLGAFNGAGCGVRSLGADRDGLPAERLFGQCFTPSLFEILGAKPLIGRPFTDAEDQVENVAPVILISYSLWQRRFGGDPAAVGRTVSLNRQPTTIIGVLPADFSLFRDTNFAPTRKSDLDFIAPLELTRTQVLSRVGGLTIVGRLKPGVSAAQVQAEVSAIAARLAASDPERHRDLSARAEALQAAAFRNYRSPLLLLQGAVAFVLLIGCANVAGLLLARATSRRSEIALRLTLGADRWRIIRQLVAESVPLAALGGLAGTGLSWGGLRLFVALAPRDFPRLEQLSLDWRVLTFTALVIMMTAILFTLIPALHASKVSADLKESSRSSTGGAHRQRFRQALVTGQIALALVLLIGAGVMIRAFVAAVGSDLGADPHNLLTFDFRLTMSDSVKQFGRYRGLGLWDVSPVPAQKFERVLERLQTVPGVVSAAAINIAPFTDSQFQMPFYIQGRPSRKEAQTADYFAVTRGYFAAMRIPLLAGRDFDAHDDAAARPVIIINQTMARHYFPDEDPVGKRVTLDFVPDEQPREIVGVASDAIPGPLARRPRPAFYVPHLQQTSKFTGPWWYLRSGMCFVLRTSGAPMSVLPAVKQSVAQVDPDTPVADVQTVNDILDSQVRNMRLYMFMLGVFGAAAAVLAATGIYGVVAYSVAERTREFGIRMALGARSRDIFLMVLRHAGRMIGAGLALGLAGAVSLRRVIQSLLSGVTSSDTATYIGVSLLLVSIAMAACLVPTRRAAAVDPNQALKYE